MESKLPLRYRKLRIAWSVGWGVICAMLIALWARSYWRMDYLTGMLTANRQIEIYSIQGRLSIGAWTEPTYAPLTHRSTSIAESQGTVRMLESKENLFGFAFIRPSVIVPLYFLAISACAITALPWFRNRFSLRTLLIATMLVAIILGIIAVSGRT
jgi:hypothetical protein